MLNKNEIKIFEIGTVFNKSGEELHVAYGDKGGVQEMSLDKFIIEDTPPDVSLSTFDFQLSTRRFVPWSLFPFIARDIAVWVPEDVAREEVEKVIKSSMGDMVVKGPELFDEFSKEDKTSYAFRLVFQSDNRTLTDVEINETMAKITNKIKANNGWQVR